MANKFQEIIEQKKAENHQKRNQSSTQDDSYNKTLKQLRNTSDDQKIKRVYKTMLNNFKVSKRFKNKDFENYEPTETNKKAFEKVKEYTKEFADRYENGDWLILSGRFGLGKTHLALAAAKEILKFFAEKYVEDHPRTIGYAGASQKAIFASSSEMVQEIRDSYDSNMINEREIMEKYKRIPLLIIDDLGTEKASEWQKEKMYMILDYRYRELKNTIITTNLNTSELKDQVSERVVERMIEAAGSGKYLWKFQGESYRRS